MKGVKKRLFGRKKVTETDTKDIITLFRELEDNENAPSIMDFTSNEAKKILGSHKPTKFLRTLCKAIYYFEKYKGNQSDEIVDFSQLDTTDVVDSLDELTGNHYPSFQGYKVLKIALYMLLMTENSVRFLHEANPIRARIFTILSALGYRLLHVTTKATLADIDQIPDIPGKTISEQYSACQSAALSQHQDTRLLYFTFSKKKAQEQDDNPWSRIHKPIMQRFRKTSLGNDNPDRTTQLKESYLELAALIESFAGSCAASANEFYEGQDANNPVTPLLVKTYEIGTDRNSVRIQELIEAGYLDTGKWGYAANFTLLTFRRSLKLQDPNLRVNVSVHFFKRLDESHMSNKDLEVQAGRWKNFMRKLVNKKEPEKFNSVHLLYNHFKINPKFKPEPDSGLLRNFSNSETCDDALYRLEVRAIDIHLTRL